MAVSANTILEVQTGGSDSANSGGFDPKNPTFDNTLLSTGVDARNAVCTVGAGNYNFAAGDVGHWLFIKSGTNWNPGWYKITSVGGTAATVDAAIGHGISYPSMTPTTVQGVGTVSAPSSGSWAVDYSQATSTGVPFTWTGTITIGGTTTQLTTSGTAWGYNMVGNVINLSGGGATTGFYVVNSYNGTNTVTLNASAGSAGGSVSGYLGGPFASPGQAGAVTAGGPTFVKSGTYSITSASPNVTGGTFQMSAGNLQYLEGYQTYRGDLGTPPLLQASGINTFTLVSNTGSNNGYAVTNISVDGAGLTSSQGFNISRFGRLYKCEVLNCTNNGFNIGGSFGGVLDFCSATGCSTQPAFSVGSGSLYGCEAYSNTITGFASTGTNGSTFAHCLSYNNSGASSDGFNTSSVTMLAGCVAYGNGRSGFRPITTANQANTLLIDCIGEGNLTANFDFQSTTVIGAIMHLCASYGGGGHLSGNPGKNIGFITQSAGSFFNNAAGGDFSLNNTVGQGALLRGTGFPGIFPAGTTTGYLDVGAAQHQDTGGGGGGGTQQAADEGGVLIIPGQAWW